MKPEAGKYRAPALEKGLDILQLLANERVPLTGSAIRQKLQRSQGEIFRMLQVLQDRGFIDKDLETEGYVLTDLLFSIAMRQPVTQSLIETAIPIMRRLAADVGQSCHLAFHSRGEIVVVARMESIEQIGFSVRVGHRSPIYKTASGVLLFAFQPSDIQKRWLDMIEPQPPIADTDRFVARAAKVRKQGYERVASAYVSGVTDLSAPIMRGDRAAAAMTVPHIKTTTAPISLDETVQQLMAAAGEITAQLSEHDSRA